jgi:hypothetical protein
VVLNLVLALTWLRQVSRWLLTAEARVQSQASQCGICGGQGGSGTGFSPSTSELPCQHRSTNAPYLFIHLPPTLYNVFLPALQFPPVSNIPLMLRTYSSVYHRHCVISLNNTLILMLSYFYVMCYGFFHISFLVFNPHINLKASD